MESDIQQKEKQSDIPPALINDMIKSGVYIGKTKSKSHPKMSNFVFTTRHNLQILDLEKTVQKLTEATEFLKGVKKSGGTILFVSTKMPSKILIKDFAEKIQMPYVQERWLGGTLTNINTILKRIEHYLDLEKSKISGGWAKYTKKEQVKMDKELIDLAFNFYGIKNLKKLPDAIFVIDAAAHKWTIREAVKTKIPVVSVLNTDSDPSSIKYPIPANSDSIDSIRFILDKISEAIS